MQASVYGMRVGAGQVWRRTMQQSQPTSTVAAATPPPPPRSQPQRISQAVPSLCAAQLSHCVRSRHSSCRVQAHSSSTQQQDPLFSHDYNDQPQQQHKQHIPPPEWHPRLFGVQDSRRAALEHSARLYFEEVWNAGSIELLDELATAGVCYNDALGMEADTFSRASLKGLVRDFQASHPLLKYDLEDVMVDEQRSTAVVTYTVTAACLLPQASGVDASGHVSVVPGMDKIHFTKSGLISSIHSFRQRFMEEEAEPINWD